VIRLTPLPPGLWSTLDLTDEEAAALLNELNGIIDGDRYFLSDRILTLKAIRAKIRPEPSREPLPPPAKRYAPPRASAATREPLTNQARQAYN
jgi:hypothetical protein